jgi:hypothetical protein
MLPQPTVLTPTNIGFWVPSLARRAHRPSRSPAAIRNATRTIAPLSSAQRSPIPSRLAPPPAMPSPNSPRPPLSYYTVAELVRDHVRQLRDGRARQLRLEKALQDAYHRLPEPNHLDTIPGIGAVLIAFILDIHRFDTPNKLVAYFGTMPIEVGSGVERDGSARPAKRYVMCPRGNDLVRRYLWMAALRKRSPRPVRKIYHQIARLPNAVPSISPMSRNNSPSNACWNTSAWRPSCEAPAPKSAALVPFTAPMAVAEPSASTSTRTCSTASRRAARRRET